MYENLDIWKDAMSYFETCQPCISYNLPQIREYYVNKEEGSDRSKQGRRNEEEQGFVAEDDPYYCYDYTGWYNVNQVSRCE